MTKEKLKEKMIELVSMNRGELIDFSKQLSMSDVDEKAKKFLNRTIDLWMDYIDEQSVDIIAIASYFSDADSDL